MVAVNEPLDNSHRLWWLWICPSLRMVFYNNFRKNHPLGSIFKFCHNISFLLIWVINLIIILFFSAYYFLLWKEPFEMILLCILFICTVLLSVDFIHWILIFLQRGHWIAKSNKRQHYKFVVIFISQKNALLFVFCLSNSTLCKLANSTLCKLAMVHFDLFDAFGPCSVLGGQSRQGSCTCIMHFLWFFYMFTLAS